jgi:hypothetical protein
MSLKSTEFMKDLQSSPRPNLLIVLLVATSLLGFLLTVSLPGHARKIAAVSAFLSSRFSALVAERLSIALA